MIRAAIARAGFSGVAASQVSRLDLASGCVSATSKRDALDVEAAGRSLAQARRVVVFCGAGLSAESGIPTYREAMGEGLWEGLWGQLGLLFFGTKLGWLVAPSLSWRVFSQQLLQPIMQAKPNPGHFALVDLERLLGSLPIVTQNVDGLSQRAGSSNILEIHGSALESRHAWTGTPEPTNFRRPNVVLFGEGMPPAYFRAVELVEGLDDRDVMLVVGTSCSVAPAAYLPYEAMLRGAQVVEINVRRELATQYQAIAPATDDSNLPLPIGSPRDLSESISFLPGNAADTLPALHAAALRARRQSRSDALFNKPGAAKSLVVGKTGCW